MPHVIRATKRLTPEIENMGKGQVQGTFSGTETQQEMSNREVVACGMPIVVYCPQWNIYLSEQERQQGLSYVQRATVTCVFPPKEQSDPALAVSSGHSFFLPYPASPINSRALVDSYQPAEDLGMEILSQNSSVRIGEPWLINRTSGHDYSIFVTTTMLRFHSSIRRIGDPSVEDELFILAGNRMVPVQFVVATDVQKLFVFRLIVSGMNVFQHEGLLEVDYHHTPSEDLTVGPGDSGAPVISKSGTLVGMVLGGPSVGHTCIVARFQPVHQYMHIIDLGYTLYS